MRDPLLPTTLKILSALHKHEYRHLVHLAVYIDMSPLIVRKAIKHLKNRNLIETWKETPTDADRSYKFTKIRLTRIGGKAARLCSELEETLNEQRQGAEG